MMSLRKISTQALFLIFFIAVSALPASSQTTRLDASEAYELSNRGDIILIDVRTPAEWKETGIGASARAISMHLPGFFDKIKAVVRGDKSKTIALICARGNRSNRMQAALVERGYTNVIDVSEGMMGSKAGPGWIALGLPLVNPG